MPPFPSPRLASIDQLRGTVMLLMLLDHVRETFFLQHQVGDPMDVASVSPALFACRLLAHLCAPVFVLLTGLSAWLYGQRQADPCRAIAGFLLKRGLFLVVLELTLVNFAWTFQFPPDTLYLQVIWAIGLSMIALAGLLWLPRPALLVLGVLLVAGHNLFDGVRVEGNGVLAVLWKVLHQRDWIETGVLRLRTSYPVLPWIGVIVLGYLMGPWFARDRDPAQRQRWLLWAGLGALAAFALLRLANGYGDAPWHHQDSALRTWMSVFNVTKYPPSLQFLLLTLGVGLLLLCVYEWPPLARALRPLAEIGAAPMFFYLLHLYVLKLLYVAALATWGPTHGSLYALDSVAGLLLVACALAVAMYPPTLLLGRFKARRRDLAWLRYPARAYNPPMNSTAIASDDFLGHPKGVYVCFFTEMWERFSFYGMKALLLLYLTKYHLFGDKAGLDLLGAYGGLVYCIPVFGGMLADRWLGMRRAVLFGGILLVLGHLGMAFEGHAAYRVNGEVVRDTSALAVTYLSLALIIMGVGFLKPNISTIVGKLYPQDDPRRDSGFSLFYAGINLGALFSSLVCGFLGEAYGWKYGFGAAGIGMLAGLAMFLWGQKYLQGHAEPPQPAALKQKVLGLPREWLIYLCAVVGVLPVAWLMWAAGNGAFALGGEISLALMLMLVVLGGVLVWFAWFTGSKCTPVQRQQMIALMVLIFMALVFFTMYEQSYGSWVTFTDRLLTKDIVPALVITGGTPLPWSIISLLLAPLGFVVSARLSERRPGSNAPRAFFTAIVALMLVLLVRDCLVIPQTAGSLTYLGGLFLVLLAPAFAALWTWMDRRGWEPGKPVKSAWGLVIGALSFVPLALAAQQVGATGEMASVWWLVLAYFLLASGEMCLSPVGLSAVTQLAVPRVMSLMMGTWFLATAFSETLAALFGKLAAIEVPEGETLDRVAAAGAYAHLFWLLMWIGLGCAVLAFIAAPLLKRMMHGVK